MEWGIFPIVHVVEWGTEKILFRLSTVGIAMIPNHWLQRETGSEVLNTVLYLDDTANRVTDLSTYGRSPEYTAEPRVILLGFMHLAKGDSPHLRFLSPYEDASFSPVTTEWAQDN